jgi:hypothetical protein
MNIEFYVAAYAFFPGNEFDFNLYYNSCDYDDIINYSIESIFFFFLH